MNCMRYQRLAKVVQAGRLRWATALALGVASSFQLRAQEIEIPAEFLTDDPPPLDLESVLGEEVDSGEATSNKRDDQSSPGDLPDLSGVSDQKTQLTQDEGALGAGLAPPTVELTSDYFGYFSDGPGAGDRHLVRGDLKLKFEGSLGENLVYTVTPHIRQDSGGNGVNTFEFRENNSRRSLVTFHEASLDWLGEQFQISVGKKIFNWGVSDAYQPLDDLNPRDFLDVPTNERIGVPALSIYHLHKLFEVQAVWEPWFSPSRLPLPGMDNRWLGDFRSIQARLSQQLGFPVGLRFAGRRLPADQFANGQFGARISSSSLVAGWDFALTYFRGRLAEGVFVGDLQGTTLVATVEYPRYHEFGASVATVVGPWQIHGEGAWHLTDNQNLDDDYIEYVVGINRSFGDIPLAAIDEVRLILEFAGQETTRGLAAGSNSFGSRQFARPFQDAVAASVVLKFSEQTELECSGAFDFADSGSIFQASLSHELNENFEVTLGTDVLSGPNDSFFGKWNANDRIFLTLSARY